MNITIKTIPHKEQRYETPGDWFYDNDGNLEIRVSELGDWRLEAIMAMHELTEVLLCKRCNITQESVDAFDKQYEADRKAGLHGVNDEPGDDSGSPYVQQHGIASGIERMLGALLMVDWNEYSNKVLALSKDE